MNLFEKIYSYQLQAEILRQDGTALPPITKQEKAWLKSMLKNESSQYFLSGETHQLLAAALDNIEGYPQFEAVLQKGCSDVMPALSPWWKILRQMILNEQHVILDFYNRGGEFFQQQTGIPWRLEYSLTAGEWYLLWWPDNAVGYPQLMRTPLQLLEKVQPMEGTDYRLKIAALQEYLEGQMKSALIQLNPEHNLNRDRVFYALSCFNRHSEYDEERDIYRIRVFYEQDEEAYLLNWIRFLGTWVVLLEPPELQNAMLQSIKKARSRYD